MSLKIEYEDKVSIQNDETIPEKNKVTDTNMNEIKQVINGHASDIENLEKFTASDFNIFRGVEEAEQLSNYINGSWSEGGWGNGSGAKPTRINIDNPPEINIRKGWHFHSAIRSNFITQANIPLMKNQIYTLSCYAKGNRNLVFVITHQELEEGTEGRIERFETPSESETEWKKYSFSFESKGKTQISIGYKKADTELIDFYICGMRLEIGKPAEDGKSAYEIAVENGFEGTVAEWLESLHGENGQDGTNGIDGQDGADGYTPIKGIDYFTQEDITNIINNTINNINEKVKWKDLTLNEKWTNIDSPYFKAQYQNIFGHVFFRGTVRNVVDADTTILILPEEIRPKGYLYAIANYSDSMGSFRIGPDGSFAVVNYTIKDAWVDLSCVHFGLDEGYETEEAAAQAFNMRRQTIKAIASLEEIVQAINEYEISTGEMVTPLMIAKLKENNKEITVDNLKSLESEEK